MNDTSITVLFTCHRCGLQRVRVLVRARATSEDIRTWMEMVAERCGRRHAFLAPQCPERKCDLLIPTPKKAGDGIGMSAGDLPDMSNSELLKSKGAN